MPQDIFDELELSLDDKISMSSDFKKFVLEEVGRQIKKIPVQAMIEKTVDVEIEKQDRRDDIFDELANRDTQESKREIRKIAISLTELKNDFESRLEQSLEKMKKEHEKVIEKLKKKYDDLKSDILNQPRYEFGGFSPQFNDLNIGDPSIEGAWRIVKSGNNLVVQRLESGIWTQKAAFTP